mmetsp:Transcript_37289/g.47917  ORF Transcript_37289/g.47917 Transcript_37289/m.47917 type:complete len:331 (+) Transcript_37289:198-1190(+)
MTNFKKNFFQTTKLRKETTISFVDGKIYSPQEEQKNMGEELTDLNKMNKLSRRNFLTDGSLGLAVALAVGTTTTPAFAETPSEQEARANLREVALLQQKAFEYTNKFNFEKADIIWTQLIQKNESIAAAWSNRGNCRTSIGRFSDAIEDFSRAMELAPMEPDPYLGRGVAFEGLGEYEKALKDYETANSKSVAMFGREDPVTYNNRANAQAGLGRWKEVRENYQKAYLMERDYVFPRASEALVLYQLGEDEASLAAMRFLVKKYPTFPDMHAGLTAVYWATGKGALAESEWSAVLQQDSRYQDINWVRTIRRWPPKATDSLEQFLTFQKR